jgi:hypothetical protein
MDSSKERILTKKMDDPGGFVFTWYCEITPASDRKGLPERPSFHQDSPEHEKVIS